MAIIFSGIIRTSQITHYDKCDMFIEQGHLEKWDGTTFTTVIHFIRCPGHKDEQRNKIGS